MNRASSLFRRSRVIELSSSEKQSPSNSETRLTQTLEENLESFNDETSSSLPAPNLKIKRVDYYWNWWSKEWKYKNMGSKVIAERRIARDGGDPWQNYCFVVVRTLPSGSDEPGTRPTFKFVVKSPYLLNACKDVIQEVPGISWNADPLEIDPELFIAFLPQFERYHDDLSRKKPKTEEEQHAMSSVAVLTKYLHNDYKRTISRIMNLTSHGEISYDMLYAIMVPRSILLTKCPITGEPRALQLISVNKVATMGGGGSISELILESMDTIDDSEQLKVSRFGRVKNRMVILPWKGTVKINTLDAYPIQYHPDEKALRRLLITRGRKWASLNGANHRHYRGIAAVKVNNKIVRYNLNGRVMVDRVTFKRMNPNYAFPVPKESDQPLFFDESVPTLTVATRNQQIRDGELEDDDLILASPVLYGFSLLDKIWLEFNVEKILPIEWNTEAFENLVLPANRKELLRTLVEAHTRDLGFDDFVQGKGQGLVINLFGNPGVGKTLSAEATSEHVQRPLYVVGAGDLGTSAFEINEALERVFDIATSWKAIVLIDEADVFMEQRSLHDLDRNAMVSVILRHLEYYRGILFLTTNRVKTIDEAFRSRTHVALHFQELETSAKVQVWTAFLAKVGITVGDQDGRITTEQLEQLAGRQINGRQIKNAVRTAGSLALGRDEKLEYKHFVETLDAMDDFTNDFNAVNA